MRIRFIYTTILCMLMIQGFVFSAYGITPAPLSRYTGILNSNSYVTYSFNCSDYAQFLSTGDLILLMNTNNSINFWLLTPEGKTSFESSGGTYAHPNEIRFNLTDTGAFNHTIVDLKEENLFIAISNHGLNFIQFDLYVGFVQQRTSWWEILIWIGLAAVIVLLSIWIHSLKNPKHSQRQDFNYPREPIKIRKDLENIRTRQKSNS